METFEAILQELWRARPPGVSGSKIYRLTQIAVQNVKESGRMAMLLYKHFKKTSGTHKLGVLYVFDSVARAFQGLSTRDETAEEGTFTGGLQQLTLLLESLMNDMMIYAPEEHKEKVRKLVDIWEKADTFPQSLLQRLRSLHFADLPKTDIETIQKKSDTNQTTPLSLSSQQSFSTDTVGSSSTSMLQTLMQMTQQIQQTQTVSDNTFGNFIASSVSAAPPGSSSSSVDPRNTYHPVLPSQTASSTVNPSVKQSSDTLLAQQRALLQFLAQQGVSAAQIQSIIQYVQSQPTNDSSSSLSTPNNNQMMLGNTFSSLQSVENIQNTGIEATSVMQHSSTFNQCPTGGRNVQGKEFSATSELFPPDSQASSRSRSPLRRKNSREPLPRPNRSPGDRGKSKIVSRQRNERSESPPSTRLHQESSKISSEVTYATIQPSKCYVRDPSIANDVIKVLSRTLFIGGVSQSVSQDELKRMFSFYGDVQSCIVNYNARHAFIKMYKRKDAEAARVGMETVVREDTVIRTKWGVGFGPRDCSNYSTGISVIPIKRLTEADRRWCVSAEWGGTGGKPLEGGYVMEEPDIEIGAGVSSKVISRRLPSGKGK